MSAADIKAFQHVPRAASIPGDYPKHRNYRGATGFVGRGKLSMSVARIADEATATIWAYTPVGTFQFDLPPDDLRELARMLIDAAADIDGGVE